MTIISVIIPAYNQSDYLGEAIESVLCQTYPHFEVIIVDDGSTDNTAEIARGFSDPRIRYVYQENRGLSGARNTGIRNSHGAYLTFLDSDDLFLPEKLSLLAKELDGNPQLGLVAGQAIPIDEHGRQFGKIFNCPVPEDASQLLLGNPLHVGSIMLRRTWQERAGYFDERLRSYEDWDLWLRLALAGCKSHWIDQPVSLYRFHRAQMTRIGSQMTTATFMVLDNLFSRPDLPEKWLIMKDLAYSRAYLRAAAQAYLAKSYNEAGSNLTKAVVLNPELTAENADTLAKQLCAWTELPKVNDPVAFLESVYNHLPDHLAILRQRRNQDIGQMAMKIAFESYQRGDFSTARAACWHAFLYQPSWIANRGALSIFIKSTLQTIR